MGSMRPPLISVDRFDDGYARKVDQNIVVAVRRVADLLIYECMIYRVNSCSERYGRAGIAKVVMLQIVDNCCDIRGGRQTKRGRNVFASSNVMMPFDMACDFTV